MTPVDLIERRLPPRLAKWARQFYAAEILFGVDPFVLAAIMDRESRGGEACHPPGPGGTGDGGNGLGLMQIDKRHHQTFAAAVMPNGAPMWKSPTFNTLYGAKLLAHNLAEAGNDYPLAIAGYNCSLRRAILACIQASGEDAIARRIKLLDPLTTGGNYVSDVLGRRATFLETKFDPQETT